VVLNGAVIGAHCLVGAGALVTEGKQFAAQPDRRLARPRWCALTRRADRTPAASAAHYARGPALPDTLVPW
jgi:carbonic anhydrase/acetyltransferase-like protein (isoleucine patch superfamily)